MKLKNLLKFGLPILGVAAIAVSLPLALTSCGNNQTSSEVSTQQLQSNLQTELSKRSAFEYYFLSNEDQLKKLVSEASSKEISPENIQSITVKQSEKQQLDKSETTTYKVDLEVTLSNAMNIDDESKSEFSLSGIDTGVQKLSRYEQNIVPTNLDDNLMGVAKYFNTIQDFNQIGIDNCTVTTSKSKKTEVELKSTSDIYKNICYLLNVDPKLVGKISFVANSTSSSETTFNLFIGLINGNNWNKEVLKLSQHGGDGVADWYGEINASNNDTKKFLYQTNNSASYGKGGNILGIYSFTINNVPNHQLMVQTNKINKNI